MPLAHQQIPPAHGTGGISLTLLPYKAISFSLPLGNFYKEKTTHIPLRTCKEIGTYIRDLRKKQGVTQSQLAGLAGTGCRFLSDLENGKETCRIGLLLRILDALGVDLHIYSIYEEK